MGFNSGFKGLTLTRTKEMLTGFWSGRPKKRKKERGLENQGLDGRIILKWFFKE